MNKQKGRLYIISGPSGSGKDTLIGRLLCAHPELKLSKSSVTRARRPGEEISEKYDFISKEKFNEMLDKNEFLEYNEYLGNMYGTPKAFVTETTKSGSDCILEIDVNGAAKVRTLVPDCVSVFIMPPSLTALSDRLFRRGSEEDEVAKLRLREALREIASAVDYDYIIVNDDIYIAVNELHSIFVAERQKNEYQKNIIEEVLKDAESFHW